MLTALLVPQGMAYAELAGLPPITGLYTTIMCLLAYAVFGPSKILVLGPDSSLAALLAIGGAIFAIVAALVRVSTRRRVLPRAEGLLLGAAAGALWGVSDVALKYLTQAPPGPLLGW